MRRIQPAARGGGAGSGPFPFVGHRGPTVQVNAIRAVTQRKRPVYVDSVVGLAESIRSTGYLLQAIGIRPLTEVEREGRTGGFALLYGGHRLAAFRHLMQTATDEEEAKRWSQIPVVIYPADMDPAYAELVEMVENLHRHELTADERAEQTVRLGAVYKKLGLVQGAKSKGNKARTSKSPDPNHSVLESDASQPLPTATEKLSADLGVSDDQIRNRANTISKATGIKISIEKSEPEVLEAAADRMVEVIERRKHEPRVRPSPKLADQVSHRFKAAWREMSSRAEEDAAIEWARANRIDPT